MRTKKLSCDGTAEPDMDNGPGWTWTNHGRDNRIICTTRKPKTINNQRIQNLMVLKNRVNNYGERRETFVTWCDNRRKMATLYEWL